MEKLVFDYGTGRPDGNIPAAGTYTSNPIECCDGDVDYAALHTNYVNGGAGGTSIDARLQTSLDGGVTWCDIINCQTLVATTRKVGAVNKYIAAAAPAVPTDGTLAANTVNNGILGAKMRVKLTIVGPYNVLDTFKVHVLTHRPE